MNRFKSRLLIATVLAALSCVVQAAPTPEEVKVIAMEPYLIAGPDWKRGEVLEIIAKRDALPSPM